MIGFLSLTASSEGNEWNRKELKQDLEYSLFYLGVLTKRMKSFFICL